MTDALFRQEVVEARRQRLAGTVIAAVPPSSRIYTGLILAAVTGLIMLLAFGSYASTASVRGIVAVRGGMSRVYSRAPGEVAQVHVRSGQTVRAGQPLVTLALAQGVRGLADQMNEIERQIAQLDRQLALADATRDTGLSAIADQREGLSSTAASLERQRSIARDQIAIAEGAVARAGRLAREGAGTQRQVEEARATLLARRADVESLGERLIATRTAAADLAAKLTQARLDGSRTASQLLAQRAVLASQRADLARSDRIVLTAPIDGEVADLAAEVGRHVTPAQSVALVVPRGSAPEVWLYAPSSAIGFARTGEAVRLRYDAFPYQKYGFGRGVIAEISRVAIDPTSVDAVLEIKEPVFRVRVTLDPGARLSEPSATIRPGMSLAADLVFKRRPLWALLLGPVVGRLGA